MFDIGFSELVLIGVIALIVIGPERLPEVARTVGKYVGRMRRFVNKVRDDIENEISQEELREALKRHADLDDVKKIIEDSRYTIENEVEETRQHVVKARDEDPRGDFSQNDLLKEQDGEFENEDYGLTDHRDYAAETDTESDTESTAVAETKHPEQVESAHTTQTTETSDATQVAESAVDTSKHNDGHNEKPKT